MSKDKVVCDDTVSSGLNAFRGGLTDEAERFIVLGYTNPNTLTVVAQGEGGLDTATEHLTDDDARYVLLRKVHKVELATTVKFAYVDWTPETVKPMRKALLSTHKGQVQEMLKPYHVSIQAGTRAELREDEIMHRISDSSGTSMHVTERKASPSVSRSLPTKTQGPQVPSTVREEQAVQFENEEEIRRAIAEVRKDDSEINWALVGYKDVKTLTLLGKGSGGVEELISKLDDNQVLYAIFRLTEAVDKSVTVKFCFLRLLSDQVRPTDRAKMSTHMGFVHKLFEPFHLEFNMDSRADFTVEYVTQKLRDNMFLDSRVRGSDFKTPASPSTQHGSKLHRGPSVNQSAGDGLKLADEEEVRKLLAAIHSNDPEKKWAVLTYSAKNTLSILASGSGGVDEMVAAFEESKVNFGLIRVTEKIDNSVTTKFVYVKWQPESFPPMQKAQISVLKGAIDTLFQPFHVDFFISQRSDLNEHIVMDKVAAASGSKSFVV